MGVKLLLRAGDDWAEGGFRWFGLQKRPGTKFADDTAEKLKLFQSMLFDHGVYIDGFALDMRPVQKDGQFDLDNYRAAAPILLLKCSVMRQTILQVEYEQRIKDELNMGHTDRAFNMTQSMRAMKIKTSGFFTDKCCFGT